MGEGSHMNLYTKLYEDKNNRCIAEGKKIITLSDQSQEIQIIGEMTKPFRYNDNLIGSVTLDKRNGNYIIRNDNKNIPRKNECLSIITSKKNENIYIPKEYQDCIEVYEVLNKIEDKKYNYTYMFSVVVRQRYKGIPVFENFIPIWIGNQELLQGTFIYYYENGNIRFAKTESENDILLYQLQMTNHDVVSQHLLDVKQYLPLDSIKKKNIKV